jgi:hypothetical protein
MRTVFSLLLYAGLLGPAVGASAQMLENVVANGEFDNDTSGWVAFDPSVIDWDPADFEGSQDSGSMVVTNPDPCTVGEACFVAATQCIPVARLDEYDFGAYILIPDQPDVDVSAQVELRYFLDSSCTQDGGGVFESVTGPTNGWVDASRTATPVPQGVAAVRVELACSKLVPETQAAECQFDSVFVLPEPAQSAGGCAALASLLLLAYRRRRAARG